MNAVVSRADLAELAQLEAQARINITGVTDEQRAALAKGLVELVGDQRVMTAGQAAWPRKGLGNKPRLDLTQAIIDCGELWTRVTRRDWRVIHGWVPYTEGGKGALINELPTAMLTRELIRLATGRAHTASLERPFRNALDLLKKP